MTVEPLTCRELVETVTAYLEGTLPPEERARFEAHIAVCPGCTAFLEQMRQTIRLTGRLREDELPPDEQEALVRLFRGWSAPARPVVEAASPSWWARLRRWFRRGATQ